MVRPCVNTPDARIVDERKYTPRRAMEAGDAQAKTRLIEVQTQGQGPPHGRYMLKGTFIVMPKSVCALDKGG